MDALLDRSVVVSLAILGAALSVLASVLQSKGIVEEKQGRLVNYLGYGVMGISMLLFVVAGMRERAA